MKVSQELLTLRKFLLRAIDGNEKVELHLSAKDTDMVIQQIDTLAMFANALEEQVIPERLMNPTPKEGDNVVVLDRFRKRQAPARGGSGGGKPAA